MVVGDATAIAIATSPVSGKGAIGDVEYAAVVVNAAAIGRRVSGKGAVGDVERASFTGKCRRRC